MEENDLVENHINFPQNMEIYTIANNLLAKGMDIVDIMKATGLTEKEILSLKEKQII